jgi:protoporphyrinogen oxidase
MTGRGKAIIIGAGPSGLTAAYELLARTDIAPVVLETSEYMGGISKTVEYKGNRLDIGGHRFFSKSDRIMEWWLQMIPLQQPDQEDLSGRKSAATEAAGDPVMLRRKRRSRIYYTGRFFSYPINLSADTLLKLGVFRTATIIMSYLKSVISPIRDEHNLEEFFINRFGKVLYLTFFKSYTEKLWGVPCDLISSEWGAQRIKGLSIAMTIMHLLSKMFKRSGDIGQKNTETSLIEEFLYPKLGPGQMWETVAGKIKAMGGEIHTVMEVDAVRAEGNRIASIGAVNKQTGERVTFEGEYFFSSMPIQDLIKAMGEDIPGEVREVSEGLIYRDFIIVGLLLKHLRIKDGRNHNGQVLDNWIYIQEPEVSVGRMQIFNNWSPYLIADSETVWIGLEYFCYETDEMWNLSDGEMIHLAEGELKRLGMIVDGDVLDGIVLRTPKAYPAYFGTYDRFDLVGDYLNRFENLFPIGRNGMHKYNNQDHSMMTAMIAVDNIIEGVRDKSNIWNVNVEEEYLESK